MSIAVLSISFPPAHYRACTLRGIHPNFEQPFYVLSRLTVLPALKKNDVCSGLCSLYSNVMFSAIWKSGFLKALFFLQVLKNQETFSSIKMVIILQPPVFLVLSIVCHFLLLYHITFYCIQQISKHLLTNVCHIFLFLNSNFCLNDFYVMILQKETVDISMSDKISVCQ